MTRALVWLLLTLALIIGLNGCHPTKPTARPPPFAIDTGQPMDLRRAAHEARLRLRMMPKPIPVAALAETPQERSRR